MQENRYRVNSYFALLSFYSFLFICIVVGVMSGCSGKSNQLEASHENVIEKRIIVELPKIGEIVTTERALELCLHYGFNHLAKRIKNNPDRFKDWKFDGCSMTSEEVLSKLINVPSLTEICLRHDLGYAYGNPANEKERLQVDRNFQNELLSTGANKYAAKAMFEAVRIGGKEELRLPFSWGFGRVEPCEPGVGLKLIE